jgi:8-oxo-dGTP pyrophosphatase MutT (NUDIX family)
VGILAILEKPTGPEILLQKQFRAPLNKITIELPAGLVDEGETVEQAAVRELKEETGFVGTVSEMSPIMFNGKYDGFIRSLSWSSCGMISRIVKWVPWNFMRDIGC